MGDDLLIGRKEIMAWMRVGEWRTITRMRKGGLPIEKIEGRWTTRRQLLQGWVDRQITKQPLPEEDGK